MLMEDKINQLFKRWTTEHLHENDENLQNTKEKNINKNSFCYDGLIDPCSNNVDVLYILKESHLANRNMVDKQYDGENYFWLREIYKNGQYGHKFIPRRLKKAQEKCFDSTIDRMAFMNINKRGGNENTNMNMLRAYADAYRHLILEEIELLQPKAIVCCDKNGEIAEIISHIVDASKYSIYWAYHPSYWGKDQIFLDSIKPFVNTHQSA